MSDLVIRDAEPAEYPAIADLTVAAYRVDGYFTGPGAQEYAAELADVAGRVDDTELLVAVDAGELVGTVTVIRAGARSAELARDGELELRMLAVAPQARGRGIGAELTRFVLRRAAEERCDRVVLCTWTERSTVYRMYERLGFQRLPDRDWVPTPGITLTAYAAPVR